MYLNYKFYFCALLIPFLYGCDRVTSSNGTDDNLPPAIPVNLQVFFAQDGTIGIEWKSNNEYDIKGYNIYRSINDTLHFSNIYFTENNYFYDDTLSYDTTYYYCITAVDNEDMESNRSIIIFIQPINFNPPTTPDNLEINARNWQDSISIYLKWSPNPESDIAGYEIFRSESSDFIPDSSNMIGLSKNTFYADNKNLELYKNYFYKIRALDNGGLGSNYSQEISDLILEIPEIYYPEDKSVVHYFYNFKIKALSVRATYKIIVQTNEYFGEIWSKEIESTVAEDTLSIPFDINYINYDTPYYWRIITYSNSTEPNSISKLHSFIIKQ
jgi:hypothetical protein